jgi:aminopeptidase I
MPVTPRYYDKAPRKLLQPNIRQLSERSSWSSEVKRGGKYFVERNGSSLIAFAVGTNYKSGDGVALIASHIDALTARLKPVSKKATKAGYEQLGVAQYAGALNSTWWDRDLGVGGKILVKDPQTGKVSSKLSKLDYPSRLLSIQRQPQCLTCLT